MHMTISVSLCPYPHLYLDLYLCHLAEGADWPRKRLSLLSNRVNKLLSPDTSKYHFIN